MKRKLTLIIILLALILAFTAGSAIAKQSPPAFTCATGETCIIELESGTVTNAVFLGSCSVIQVQMGIFILCN